MSDPESGTRSDGNGPRPILPDRWHELAPLVDALLDTPVALRSSALAELSKDDAELRAELEQLVAECERDVPVLDRPVTESFALLLAEDAETPPPDTLGGRYRIEREVGRGGMARVYLARDTKHSRAVAVKVIRRDLAASLGSDRFLREIEIAASLRHPNIVPLYDSGDTDGVLYFVMPYEEGPSLRERLRTGPAMSAAECVSALRDVARALAYAHEHGVVHRDVKPDNVMMSSGAAVVADFGIAKAVSAAHTGASLGTITQAGAGLGTPAYMAPEQAIGDPSTDHRADIYSFGCLAYELFAGHPPFHNLRTHEVIAAHVGTPPVPLADAAPEVPPAIAHLVGWCLEKNPDARPQTAQALVVALEGARAEPNEPKRRTRSPITTVRALLLIAGVLVLGGAGYLASRGRATLEGRGTEELTLAVLPLRALGGDSMQSDMADGLSDEVATSLFAVPGIRVMSRGAVGRYRARDIDPREVGEALGARLLVMGSLRSSGARLTVTVNLVDTQDGTNLWGAVLDRPDGDFTAVREDIVRSVEREIRTRFGTPAATVSTPRGPPSRTVNREAALYYTLGQGALTRRGQSMREAVDWFRRATQADTLYAPAYSGLSLALVLMPYFHPTTTREVAAEAAATAERALRLDSTLAQPHVALGLIYQHASDWNRAATEYETALRLRSDDDVEPLVQYGRHLLFRGRVDEGMARLLEARNYEPASAVVSSWVAYAYYLKGQLDSAVVESERAFEADSTNITTLTTGSLVQLRSGRPERARQFVARILGRNPPVYYVLAALGDSAALSTRMAALESRTGEKVWMAETGRAFMFLGRGDTAQALAALERATDISENWTSRVSAVSDPVFDPLKGNARYEAVLRRVGLGAEARRPLSR